MILLGLVFAALSVVVIPLLLVLACACVVASDADDRMYEPDLEALYALPAREPDGVR